MRKIEHHWLGQADAELQICLLLLQKNFGVKLSAEKVEQIIPYILCLAYYGKSHWEGVKSSLLTKFWFSRERLGSICSEFYQWKTKPYSLLLWKNISFLFINSWNIILIKMDAISLGHSVRLPSFFWPLSCNTTTYICLAIWCSSLN